MTFVDLARATFADPVALDAGGTATIPFAADGGTVKVEASIALGGSVVSMAEWEIDAPDAAPDRARVPCGGAARGREAVGRDLRSGDRRRRAARGGDAPSKRLGPASRRARSRHRLGSASRAPCERSPGEQPGQIRRFAPSQKNVRSAHAAGWARRSGTASSIRSVPPRLRGPLVACPGRVEHGHRDPQPDPKKPPRPRHGRLGRRR
jgi:hypothetical protein